jgi:predicted PurR-regulated permease PerM
MESSKPMTALGSALLYGAAAVIVLAGAKFAAAILVPLLLAAFIGVITTPLFLYLRRYLPGWLSLLVMICALVLLGFGIGSLVEQTIAAFTARSDQYAQALATYHGQLIEYLVQWGFDKAPEELAFAPSSVVGMVTGSLSLVAGLLSQGFLVTLVVVFIWFEAGILGGKVAAALPAESVARLTTTVEEVRNYITIKTWMSLLTGVLVTILLSVMGVDYAIPLGLLAVVLNYVPTIGSLVAGVPGVALALLDHGLGTSVVVTIGYVVVNVGVSNGLEPRVMGQRLGLSPLVIILSMFFWGWALGPIGMLLSVPLTMIIRIALDGDPTTKPLAILLGGARSQPPMPLAEDDVEPVTVATVMQPKAAPSSSSPGPDATVQ